MKPHTIKLISWSLITLNLALAVVITIVEPSKWVTIPAGGLLLPSMLLVIIAFHKYRGCSPEALTEIYTNLNFATLMITLALGITLTNIIGFTSGDIGDRMIGAMLGLLVAFSGNRLPKQITDRCLISGDAARGQRVTRRVGYIMVVSGLLMACSWIVFGPRIASLTFIGIGLVMTITTITIAVRRPRSFTAS